MDTKPSQSTPILLFVIWCISGLAFTAFNKYTQILGVENSIFNQKNTSLIITMLATVLYFIPMLIAIYHQAKKASLQWLMTVSRLFLYLFCGALAIFLIAFLFVLWRMS